MSYCRWSTDGFTCDVYVYQDVSGGWTTHVASRRRWLRAPGVGFGIFYTTQDGKWELRNPIVRFVARRISKVWMWVASLHRIELPGPHAGQTYNDPTPGACADRLEAIRVSGLNVPQDVINVLREENKEFREVD